MVTGRPQAEQPFSAWAPQWIQPSDEKNQADMRLLLDWQLHQGRFVADSDLQTALDILLAKSQVGFC